MISHNLYMHMYFVLTRTGNCLKLFQLYLLHFLTCAHSTNTSHPQLMMEQGLRGTELQGPGWVALAVCHHYHCMWLAGMGKYPK